MRTTLTLDDDLFMDLHARRRATGRSFKDVVSQVMPQGLLDSDPPREIVAPTLDMGAPRIDVTKALDLAMQTDDEWEKNR